MGARWAPGLHLLVVLVFVPFQAHHGLSMVRLRGFSHPCGNIQDVVKYYRQKIVRGWKKKIHPGKNWEMRTGMHLDFWVRGKHAYWYASQFWVRGKWTLVFQLLVLSDFGDFSEGLFLALFSASGLSNFLEDSFSPTQSHIPACEIWCASW